LPGRSSAAPLDKREHVLRINSMDMKKLRRPRKFLIVFIIAGFAFFGLAFKFYENKFGQIGATTTIWGEFGSYFGGVLGPVFNFLTFIGLLWTISLNYEQLSLFFEEKERQKIQDKKEDLYKVIESIHNKLGNVLEEKLFCDCKVFLIFTELNVDTINNKNICFNDLIADDIIKLDLNSINSNYHIQLVGITRLILALQMYVLEYEKLSNDRILSGYYRIYYLDVAFLLEKLKMLDKHTFDFYNDLSFERNLLRVKMTE
jgi:hypothetical protein